MAPPPLDPPEEELRSSPSHFPSAPSDPPEEEEELRSSPSHFPSALSKVAASQICRSIGYRAADPSALRSLSDILTRYIAAVARSAAAIAAVRGRTDSNVLDVVRGMEALALPRGFAGASDPRQPLLKSRPLRELMAFTEAVDEVPFARPIRRRGEAAGVKSVTFAEAGREPPSPHVPRWLPCFPESWGEEGCAQAERKDKRWEEEVCIKAEERETPTSSGGRRGAAVEGGDLQLKREKVRFKLELGAGWCCVNKKRKRVSPSSSNRDDTSLIKKRRTPAAKGGAV